MNRKYLKGGTRILLISIWVFWDKNKAITLKGFLLNYSSFNTFKLQRIRFVHIV